MSREEAVETILIITTHPMEVRHVNQLMRVLGKTKRGDRAAVTTNRQCSKVEVEIAVSGKARRYLRRHNYL